jgi:hypothetical protein
MYMKLYFSFMIICPSELRLALDPEAYGGEGVFLAFSCLPHISSPLSINCFSFLQNLFIFRNVGKEGPKSKG